MVFSPLSVVSFRAATYAGRSLCVVMLVVFMGSCAGGSTEGALTEKEESTLDRELQSLVRGDTSAAESAVVGRSAEGKPIYAVFIHVSNRQAFEKGDITVNSWSGSIATARLSLAEIRRTAGMESVEAVQLSEEARPH